MKKILLVVLLLFIFCAGYSQSLISIGNKIVDIGLGSNFDKIQGNASLGYYASRIYIKNVGSKELLISSIMSSCGCVYTDKDIINKSILSGSLDSLNVYYSVTRGDYTKVITIQSNASNSPTKVFVTVNGANKKLINAAITFQTTASSNNTSISTEGAVALTIISGALLVKGIEWLADNSGRNYPSSNPSSAPSNSNPTKCYEIINNNYPITVCGFDLVGYKIHCNKKDRDLIVIYYPTTSSGDCIFRRNEGWYSHGCDITDSQWSLLTYEKSFEEAAKEACDCE